MEGERWVTSHCLNKEGFPKLLYSTMARLGILDHPEYMGREYEEYGTERCEVTIYIRASKDFPDIKLWSVTTTGFRFEDTYQAIACKALRYLCQIYEKPICHTPMRYFPDLVRNRPIWITRMKTLEGCELREDNPTVVFMARYLLTLDEEYDKQATKLKECNHRVEEAEKQIRKLCVQLAESKAQVTISESREIAAIEALKQAEDRHAQELKDAYLVTRVKRRALILGGKECDVLDGIPIVAMDNAKKKFGETPPAPPPTEVSEEASDLEPTKEEVLQQNQPPAESKVGPPLIPLEGPSSLDE